MSWPTLGWYYHKEPIGMSIDPSTFVRYHEATASFNFDVDTGYTYNSTYVEFSGGYIRLKDLGGGTYSTDDQYVVFPLLTPSQVRQWIRFSSLSSEPTGTSAVFEFRVSNDGGENWGISYPDYNDGNWREYNLAALQAIVCYENGDDQIAIRLKITSDGTATPEIDDLEVTYYIYSNVPFPQKYEPIFSTKYYVSRMNPRVEIIQVEDVAMEAGEQWVIDTLMNGDYGAEPIWYEDLLGLTSGGDWARRLRIAATYSILCILGQGGVGEGVSGPIDSISADGVSIHYSRVQGQYKGAEDSPLDYCEMAMQAVRNIVKIYYALGKGSGGDLMIKRYNEFFDPSYNTNLGDSRRWNGKTFYR